MNLPAPYQERLLHDEPLGRYTAARLGGAADGVYIARESAVELALVMQAAWSQGVPVRVLGGGANVLISDAGFRGLVVINDVTDIQFGDWHERRNVAATAGVGLTVLARAAQPMASIRLLAHGLSRKYMAWIRSCSSS